MRSKEELAKLWYHTKNPYYQDVYAKAYGVWLHDDESRESERPREPHNRRDATHRREKWRFLDLAPELRNRIYQYAFHRHDAMSGTTAIPTIGLLATCKQIHKEASFILYRENTFTFTATIEIHRMAQIQLSDYPVTQTMAIWPAKTYHKHLRALHIKFNFNGGYDGDLNPPPIFEQQLRAMRAAFDEAWAGLALTIEFLRMSEYSFTTFWLKMSLFEPLSHPECKIVLPEKCKNPEIGYFLLEHILLKRDFVGELPVEQQFAFDEAQTIARFSFESRICFSCSALAERMAYADPDYGVLIGGLGGSNILVGGGGTGRPNLIIGGPDIHQEAVRRAPPNPGSGGPGVLSTLINPGQAPGPTPCKWGNRLEGCLRTILGFRNPRTVAWLMTDNELRLMAAIRYPGKSRDLIPGHSLEMKVYVGMVVNLGGRWRRDNEGFRKGIAILCGDDKAE